MISKLLNYYVKNGFPSGVSGVSKYIWFYLADQQFDHVSNYPMEWFNAVAHGEYFYPWAATLNGEIVGIIVADIWSRDACDKCDRDILPPSKYSDDTKIAYILTFGVVKEYRRMGIGSLLLDNLIHELTVNCDASDPAKSVKALYLHVQCDNRTAITFYESQNFRVHRYLPWYYWNSTGNGDAYSYVRYINGATSSWIYSYSLAKCPIVGAYRVAVKLPYLFWRLFRVLQIHLYRVPTFRVSSMKPSSEKQRELFNHVIVTLSNTDRKSCQQVSDYPRKLSSDKCCLEC